MNLTNNNNINLLTPASPVCSPTSAALEAIESAGDVLENALRVQGRLEASSKKLSGVKTAEAQLLLGFMIFCGNETIPDHFYDISMNFLRNGLDQLL